MGETCLIVLSRGEFDKSAGVMLFFMKMSRSNDLLHLSIEKLFRWFLGYSDLRRNEKLPIRATIRSLTFDTDEKILFFQLEFFQRSSTRRIIGRYRRYIGSEVNQSA